MHRYLLALAAACLAVPALAQRPATPVDRGMQLNAYPAFERKLPDRFYVEGRRFTPRDYVRLRASGFSQDEALMIANATRLTGLDHSVFANAIYRGDYARQISLQFGVSPNRLTAIDPEWRTAEWAAATGEPGPTRDRLNVYW